MNIQFPYAGEILSLSSAFFWALAVVIMKKIGEKVHPVTLNLFKNTFGATFLRMQLRPQGAFCQSSCNILKNKC